MPDQLDCSIEITRRRFLVGGSAGRLRGVPRRVRHQGAAGRTGADRRHRRPRPAAHRHRGAGEPGRARRRTSAELNWANWCCYLDVDPADDTKWKTLEDFQAAHGTAVNYQEVIDENEGFVASDLEPDQGQPGSRAGTSSSSPTGWSPASSAWAGSRSSTSTNMPNYVANVRDVYKDQHVGRRHEPPRPVADRHDRHRLRPDGHRASSRASSRCSRSTRAGRARPSSSPRCATRSA